MTAWKLFPGQVAHVSTPEFHAGRERADHLGDPVHRPRLLKAADMVRQAALLAVDPTVSDLGCGDGGLLSLIPEFDAWGYDFTPANAAGWPERGVKAELLDIFGADQDRVRLGTIVVMTEVLEHLSDPAAAVRWVRGNSRFLVASSPWVENGRAYNDCHAWAFDPAGYRLLLEAAGFVILRHELVGNFQVLLAENATARAALP